MHRYSLLFVCLLTIFSCKVIHEVNPGTQYLSKDISVTSNNPTIAQQELIFPDDWLGYWEGDLCIYNTSGLQQTISMALDNSTTDVEGQYNWAIIYGPDSITGRRDYVLNEVDKNTGHYVVDEKNGIILDAYLIDNELISVFEVMGNSLTSTYRRESDNLYFEIIMYKSQYTSITGDTIIESDTIPAVKSYKPFIKQKAVLRRRN